MSRRRFSIYDPAASNHLGFLFWHFSSWGVSQLMSQGSRRYSLDCLLTQPGWANPSVSCSLIERGFHQHQYQHPQNHYSPSHSHPENTFTENVVCLYFRLDKTDGSEVFLGSSPFPCFLLRRANRPKIVSFSDQK